MSLIYGAFGATESIPPGPFGFFRGRESRSERLLAASIDNEYAPSAEWPEEIPHPGHSVGNTLALMQPDGTYSQHRLSNPYAGELGLKYIVLARTNFGQNFTVSLGDDVPRRWNMWQTMHGRTGLANNEHLFYPARWLRLHRLVQAGEDAFVTLGSDGASWHVRLFEHVDGPDIHYPYGEDYQTILNAAQEWDQSWGGPVCG